MNIVLQALKLKYSLAHRTCHLALSYSTVWSCSTQI